MVNSQYLFECRGVGIAAHRVIASKMCSRLTAHDRYQRLQ